MQSYNSYRGGASSEDYVDKNYKIPKRKASEMDNSSSTASNYNAYYNQRQQNQNQQQNRQQNQQPHQQTPLANSYYNYNNNSNYQYPNTTAYYGAYAQYYSAYNTAMNAAQPPPPPPPGDPVSVDPVTQGIYKALTEIKEKPKNYRSNIYSNNNSYYKQRKGSKDSPKYMTPFQNTVPDILDETLPKELKALFQPLFCKLCSSQLSSNLNAKMHYKSKNHEKKIKKWLVEYSERTGEPLHKRAKLTNEQKSEESDKNPAWFHCDICDLPLTGKLHAESHYSGRNHQKAMLGHKTPAGNGYYNNEGKWVRTTTAKSKSYNFENGEDNFGNVFRPNTVASVEIGPKPAKQPKLQTTFTCEVCNINTTCQEQLETHYRGAKHQKKLKQVGLTKYTEQRELVEKSATISAPPINFTALTENLPLPSNGKSELSLSVYRTPSGDYYCPSCNITTNAESQFVQHMASKNHSKKVQKKN